MRGVAYKARRLSLFLAIIFIVYFVDRGSKFLFLRSFPERINLNGGVGFGFLPQYNAWWLVFSIMAFVTVLFYVIFCHELENLGWFALFLGAVLGNIVDRVVYGGVLDFYVCSLLPMLNVADLLLTVVLVKVISNRYLLWKKES